MLNVRKAGSADIDRYKKDKVLASRDVFSVVGADLQDIYILELPEYGAEILFSCVEIYTNVAEIHIASLKPQIKYIRLLCLCIMQHVLNSNVDVILTNSTEPSITNLGLKLGFTKFAEVGDTSHLIYIKGEDNE